MLGLAEWPEAVQGNFRHFWAERFHMRVSLRLQELVYPFQKAVRPTASGSVTHGQLCLLLLASHMAGMRQRSSSSPACVQCSCDGVC